MGMSAVSPVHTICAETAMKLEKPGQLRRTNEKAPVTITCCSGRRILGGLRAGGEMVCGKDLGKSTNCCGGDDSKS